MFALMAEMKSVCLLCLLSVCVSTLCLLVWLSEFLPSALLRSCMYHRFRSSSPLFLPPFFVPVLLTRQFPLSPLGSFLLPCFEMYVQSSPPSSFCRSGPLLSAASSFSSQVPGKVWCSGADLRWVPGFKSAADPRYSSM